MSSSVRQFFANFVCQSSFVCFVCHLSEIMLLLWVCYSCVFWFIIINENNKNKNQYCRTELTKQKELLKYCGPSVRVQGVVAGVCERTWIRVRFYRLKQWFVEQTANTCPLSEQILDVIFALQPQQLKIPNKRISVNANQVPINTFTIYLTRKWKL